MLSVSARHPEAAVIARPRSNGILSATATTVHSPLDRHVQVIGEIGRMAWLRTSRDNARAKKEAVIARYRQVIDDRLRVHSDKGHHTELIVAGDLLNRMVGLAL